MKFDFFTSLGLNKQAHKRVHDTVYLRVTFFLCSECSLRTAKFKEILYLVENLICIKLSS